MTSPAPIPTWLNLFGSPDVKDADAGRSVTSPAAYLADLLQLLEDRFDASDFRARRPDIPGKIKLNGEQSFTLTRQLDIVNQLLAQRVDPQQPTAADQVLAQAKHPFLLPFEYQDERVRQLLRLLQTPPGELYRGFIPRADVDVFVREKLGLSPARAAVVANDLSKDAAGLHDAYGLEHAHGLDKGETLADLADLNRFQGATQLDAPTLSQLLFSQLSQTASKGPGPVEREAAGVLFINHGLGGYVSLDSDEQKLTWSDGEAIQDAWFDRVHRILCLSRWSGIDLLSLDLVLRQLCGNTLDSNALRRIAVLVSLRDATKAPLDVLCAVFGELDGAAALGAGDGDSPASLFDRVFNGDAASLSKRFLSSGSGYLPQAYVGWTELAATGDLLSDDGSNREFRSRIQAALGVSGADLAAIVTRFRDRAVSRGRVSRLVRMDSRSLSVLYRVVQLAEFADVAPLALLQLIEVMESDPALKVLNAFDVFYHEGIGQSDFYQVLEDGPLEARLWLIQNVVAVATWAATASLDPEDVESIACVPQADPPPQNAQAQDIQTQNSSDRAFVQTLQDAFAPTALTADSLQSDAINERTARVALATFGQPAWGLVCPDDKRLVTWDQHKARKAAHAVLQALDVVSTEDIEAMQLGEGLATYLQTLLICRGVLDTAGVLQEGQLPARPEDLTLEPDGSDRFAQIFAFLNKEYTTALAQEAAVSAAQQAQPSGQDSAPAGASANQTSQDGSGIKASGDQSSGNGSGVDASADQSSGDGSSVDASPDQPSADGSSADASGDQTSQIDSSQNGADVQEPQQTAQGNNASAASDVEIYLYHSDLLKLGFSLSEVDEWIERLTYLGLLDGTGMVKDPSLFSDPANLDSIRISAGVDAFRQEIHGWLAGRRDRWLDATLTLPGDIWDATPLTAAERQSLEQNLVFNHYIDAARGISDRKAVETLTPDTFDLALQFYRHRGSILDALRGVVANARQTYLTVSADDLRPLADKFAAADVHRLLSAGYLDDQMRLNAAAIAAIGQDTPPLDLGPTYSAAQTQQVWSLLQQVNTDAGKFRLTDTAVTSAGIPADHTSNVFASLCADGCVQPDHTLSAEQVKHFEVVTRAHEFILRQYADYSREVFFLIHDVAVATGSAVKALTSSLKTAADGQEQAVLAAVGSQAGISPDAASAILKPMLPQGQALAEAIMLPVLRTAIDGVIKEPPIDRRFRALIWRMTSFATLAVKLRMSPRQIEAAFKHQQLAGKFPEGIELPHGVERIDALWAGPSGQPSGSSTLCAADLVNLQSLADKLSQPGRPIDEWIAGQLTPDTVAALGDYIEGDTNRAPFESALLQDINRLLAGSSIYDSQRFSGITLRPRVQTLVTLSLQSGDIPGLNRLLLEDAYTVELARNELYLFCGSHYWTYDANTLEMNAGPIGLEALCPDFKGLSRIDAIYTLPNGDHWLLAGGNEWRREGGSQSWAKAADKSARLWGRIQSKFEDPVRIDGALNDKEGRIHLICGDQYVRYSNWPQEFVDEGFPKRITTHWARELGLGQLPSGWDTGVNAAAGRDDEATWLFKDDSFVASNEPGVERKIVDFWGRVRNNLASASHVDAVLDIDGRCGIVAGDQVSVFSNSLESEDLTADEGYPRKITSVFPNLPEAFAQGFDAGVTDSDGTIHLFREQTCATRGADGKWESHLTSQRWGLVDNALQRTGRVDAAFAGLDGRIYVFSGEQYVRYSGSDLSRIDEGYPKAIRHDWGGLQGVEAAFVLDGKTYVFGSDHVNYLRFSTRDYTKPDDGYPKPIDDNWWNLPVALLNLEFHKPDSVFVDAAGHIHLFRGAQTVRFDHNHRWWSEPAAIRETWKSLPFNSVSAAFTGRDGRTYVFSNDGEPAFARYSSRTFEHIDDRFPKPVREHWGKLVNNIERTGRVDAAVMIISAVNGAESGKKVRYRYIFSGDQFYRYRTDGQQFADEGYPLRIANNLRRELHFARLDAPATRGVDGVWADTGNVFVFISGEIYAASTAHCRQLDGFGVEQPHAADVEEGRLTILGKSGWRHILPPEANTHAEQPGFPRALRTVPPAFQENLSAILRGVDGNVYLFNEGQCYDKSLERQYPAGAVWGRVRNLIAEDERVDSALMGRDGKLYLFRGDQFVSYTPAPETPTKIPDFPDANPSAIASHWGGLQNVCHSFAHKGVTYLLERPAADGSFRYIRYFGTDYSRPADSAPLSGDFSFWNIPDRYLSRGFDRVDAVLCEGDGLILIRDAEFLHYDSVADLWSPPRPLTVRWPGLVRHYPDFETISAVVRVPDGKTYFFAQGSWVSHDGNRPALAEIASSWALLHNRIVQTGRVDATLVHDGQTFLFSGDEYVRYSDTEYKYADQGYPRPIGGNLRTEVPFKHLPEDVEGSFAILKPEDTWVAAACDIGGTVYVTLAGRTYAISAQLNRTYPLQQIANVRNELLRRERVDAAFARKEDGALFLLSGDQYVRYSKPDLDEVDEGYPRSIADSLLSELQGEPAKLPLVFQENLHGALYLKNRTLILFKHKKFVQHDPGAKVPELIPVDIRGHWGRISNPFLASSSDPHPRIDAAFIASSQALYVFKGNQYLRYSDPTAEFVDEGYPRAIRDEWGDLPDDFKTGFDGSFVFDGRTYLCRGNRYVRYSDPKLRRFDPIYPQLFTNRWRASNAFLLGDLRAIQRYVALDAKLSSGNGSLTDFLLAAPAEKPDPYGLLAALFDCEVGDVQWLKRRDAFLDRPSADLSDEQDFDIALVLRIYATLERARRLGSHPQELYEQVWTPLYGSPRDATTAANTLERLLGTLYPGDNWQKIQGQLGDALSALRRDALVAWLMSQRPKELIEVRDLSDSLLSDVEVDPGLDTSPIVEAIAAVQLYFYRYLANLEPAAAAGDDATRRPKFKAQWRWLQNYRVWEANRKVFLYPESYIQPQLRSSRTAAFQSLQQNLQQGEITNDSVTQAYKQYLDEYTEVSRLIISGGYVWQPDPNAPDTSELTLFGATRTNPRRYYYRTATFHDNNGSSTTSWQDWQALGIDIKSDRVYPVRAFGRTFVFWPEIETLQSENQSTTTLQTTTKDNTQTVKGDSQNDYRVNVMYSFHDLNGKWTAPQTLTNGPREGKAIEDTHVRVSGTQNSGEEAIEVDFSYDLAGDSELRATLAATEAAEAQAEQALHLLPGTLTRPVADLLMGLAPRARSNQLTADLTVTNVGPFPPADNRADMLRLLFDANDIGTLNNVIAIGSAGQSSGAPWYSFDIKGGSFLARPTGQQTLKQTDVNLLPLAGNTEGLPEWDHVDACLDGGADGSQYLFNNHSMTYAVPNDPVERPIRSRWGIRKTQIHVDGMVDAAWQRDGVWFLSRGDKYLKYSHDLDLADPIGERIAANDGKTDGVPNWPSIGAAFTDHNKTTWFFHGSTFVTLDANKIFGPETEIKQRWGRELNNFTSPTKGEPAVIGAFTRDGRSFLIGPASFIAYADAGLTLCETPKNQSLGTMLDELHCTNSGEADRAATISGVTDTGTELLFKVRSGAGSDVYSFAANKTVARRPPVSAQKTAPVESEAAAAKPAPEPDPTQYIAYFVSGDRAFGLTLTPRGTAVTISGSSDQRPYSQDIRAAFPAPDGGLYLFGVDSYVHLNAAEISLDGIGNAVDQWASRSASIAARFGRVSNAVTRGGPVTAAFVRGDNTFLISGDSYFRYSGAAYDLADTGYPKPLAANPDRLPEVPFQAPIEMPDGRMCYVIGTNHVFDNALQQPATNQSRWGLIRTNILVRGVDTAYRVDDKHCLFSGNEIAWYTADSGKLPLYMDGAPVTAELGSFGSVRGVFAYENKLKDKHLLYLVGRDSFACCNASEPEQTLPEYPRNGMAGALVSDLRRQFNLPAAGIPSNIDQYEIYAISLQGSVLAFDTDDITPGQRVFKLDLSNGVLSRDFSSGQSTWAALRRQTEIFVDLPTARYTFLAGNVAKTKKGQGAVWDSNHDVRAITAVWGGRPFDAAIPAGSDLYLFVRDLCCKLAQSQAGDSDPNVVVANLRNALALRKPISGLFTNMPAALLDGFDASLPAGDGAYVFKGNQFAKLTGDSKLQPVTSLKYDLTRLTTSTAARLNREFFIGGVSGLLSLAVQESPETPAFVSPDMADFSATTAKPSVIRVNTQWVNKDTLPQADYLDFGSANGIYLWEIFLHAPALIAGMLSTAQRFEEAKAWYEYIFDPTEPANTWKFLPFLTEDVARIVQEIRDRLDRLDRLEQNHANVSAVRKIFADDGHLDELLDMHSALQGERDLGWSRRDTKKKEFDILGALGQLPGKLDEPLNTLIANLDQQHKYLGEDLRELAGIASKLQSKWESLQTMRLQIETYLDDPFDPHAIAALRPIAYRKAIVMAYLDNLLSWADMLFGEYTRESMTEARMIYVEAWNVLGRQPQSLGRRILPKDSAFDDLRVLDGKSLVRPALRPAPGLDYDMLMQIEDKRIAQLSFAGELMQAPQQPPAQPYFFIPPNDQLTQYWTRVSDRLYKIRHGLNILGVKQPLALFEPPLNPMDLVSAEAGAGLAGLDGATGAMDVPHYRFTFLLAKAQGLAQKVAQLGSELLAALEKRDAETLARLQVSQEAAILGLTRDMQNAQLAEAQANLLSLQKARDNAQKRKDTYQSWLDADYLPMEAAQIALLSVAAGLNTAATIFNLISAVLSLAPDVTIGVFSMGTTEGGKNGAMGAQSVAAGLQSTASVVQGIAEILGISAQHMRAVQDWTLQRDLAAIDLDQINAQIQGANWQIQSAQLQLQIAQKQIEQNKAVSDFYRSKFTNQELYEWMIARLSALHYGTYQLALDKARAAERSFQFERGGSQTSFIHAQTWDSQRKGLLAGYSLGLALDRMDSAFTASDARRFEITKAIQLIEIDPMAFLQLKAQGVCEFDLGEALFDYDFPGHYCRQVKSIAVDLNMGDGIYLNATLTQLTNRVVMEPDAKAVGFLLAPKDAPPLTLRTDWKAQQQIALSSHTQYETNSGVFELIFEGDRYLPFEGTGAVSRWRLELGGPPGKFDLTTLSGVTITLKYTALQGGDAFAASVRGMLKPATLLRAFNLSVDFADAWQAFLQGDSDTLALPMSQPLFPSMVSSAIPAIFARYEYGSQSPGSASFVVDYGVQVALPDGKAAATSGLAIRAAGTNLNLILKGDKTGLKNVYLLMQYKGGLQ